jgi:hypothetical protein
LTERIEREVVVVRMDVGLNLVLGDHGTRCSAVIDMTVRQEQSHRGYLVLGEEFSDPDRIGRGIDEHA